MSINGTSCQPIQKPSSYSVLVYCLITLPYPDDHQVLPRYFLNIFLMCPFFSILLYGLLSTLAAYDLAPYCRINLSKIQIWSWHYLIQYPLITSQLRMPYSEFLKWCTTDISSKTIFIVHYCLTDLYSIPGFPVAPHNHWDLPSQCGGTTLGWELDMICLHISSILSSSLSRITCRCHPVNLFFPWIYHFPPLHCYTLAIFSFLSGMPFSCSLYRQLPFKAL